MNVLSLFDGISCGQLALQRASIKIDNYYASEIEKDSIKITQKNFPDTIQIGDVTKVDSNTLPKIDLLIGGSPCQSFSNCVSSNTGFDGKSKLFFEYVRLLKDLKPTYFLLENVLMKPEWKSIITNNVGCEHVEINSELFSAQSRPRLYWTNIPILLLPEKSPLVINDILDSEVDDKYWYNKTYDFHGEDKTIAATLHINGHDILKRVHSRYSKCHTLTAVCGGNQQKKVYLDGKIRKLTPSEYEKLQTLPVSYTDSVCDGSRYKSIGNSWTVDVISHIFKGIMQNL